VHPSEHVDGNLREDHRHMTAGGSSIPEVHALLRALAAGRRAAEIGTAFGDGARAIASTAETLVTVELDPERAESARKALAGVGNVIVLEGDWREVLPPHAPFDFVFVDGGGQETKTDPSVLDLGRHRTLFVLDDLTPGYQEPNPVRELWLGSDRLTSAEIMTTPTTAAIVASPVS
jgi:predicted O-methyltransferase YrrM